MSMTMNTPDGFVRVTRPIGIPDVQVALEVYSQGRASSVYLTRDEARSLAQALTREANTQRPVTSRWRCGNPGCSRPAEKAWHRRMAERILENAGPRTLDDFELAHPDPDTQEGGQPQ